jgi:hypothetical protein
MHWLENFPINHSPIKIFIMKSILLFLLILIFHVSSFAQSDPVAIAQNIELFPDVRGDYTVTASAVDNGSSDTDGPISTTIETALTTSRPAITYNQTHINKGSVYFDGNDKRISTTVQNLPLGNSARTIEFWMRPQATGAFQYILDYGVGATNQRFAIYIAGTRMGVAYGGNAAEISGINSFNEWAHYAITYSTRTFKFYKNGVLIGQSTIASDLQTANSQFFIGNLFNTTNFDFKGDITELKIHRVAKTDAELLTDYNKYSTGNESETVFYNKLNEGTGNAINDGKFLSAGNLAVGGGGSQPVWSSSYPTAAFQNSIGTYHVILMVTDNTGNTTTDDAVITLNNSVPPVVQSQNIVATLDSNGQATITPQQVNNGTLDAYGNAVTNFSLNQTTFNCSDLASIDLNSQYVADLRGANDYISAGSSSTLQVTTAFSYAGWINNTSRNLESMLVNREGEYEVALRNNGNIAYALANSSPGWDWVETNVNVPLNKWAHVAFTYESGSPKIYLNGKLEYTGTGTGAIGDVTTFQNDVRFGWRQNQGGNAKFTGFMDEISLWNRVLSAQEIKNLVTTTLSGRESGLLVHYAIENGTTATLVDSSSNNLSGTIVSPVATPRPLNTDYRDAYGTEVTLTATDSFGTTATATAFVEVQDVTVPVITCPSNISENSLDASGKVVTYTLPTIQDACVTGATAIDPSNAFPQPNGTTLLGTFNNHTYFLSDTSILPSDAFAATASTPYKLATINSAAENDFLTAFVDDGTGFLLGFNDVASEGAFLWQDGSTASYTNWNANEPNNSAGSEDFTVLLPNGKWNDIGDGSRKYIVELPYIYEQTAGIATGANFPIGTTTNMFIFNDGNGNTATCSFDVELILEAVPTLDVVSIVSNNVDDSAFAKAGNIITLNFTASEDLANTPVVTIAGQNATVSQGANARSWIATFQMPTVQATSLVDLPNGIAGFTINFIDLASIAGVEVTSTTDASQVSLNRTPPTAIAQDIELCPDGSGVYIANATSIDNGSSDPDEGIVPTIETSLASGVASQNFNQTHINKGSIYFDGNDRSVSTPIQNLPSGNSARTIEFWMKPSVTSQTGQYVFDYGVGGTFRRYAVLVNTDGRLGVLLGGGIAFTNSPVFTFDTWAHYSITYENRVFIFYIDGVEVGRNTIPRDLDTGNSNLIIGNLLNNTTFDFKGNLSELRIYDRAKTPTQITTNYKKYLAGNEEGLVYYNKLNEGTGAAIDDSRFNIAGDIPIGGTGQPVWSTDYPSITFDNEIGTYHTILTATDSNGNVATDDAVVTLKDGTPVVQAQDLTISLDSGGNATITPQQVDNGSTVCEGAVNLSLDRTLFDCSDFPAQVISVQQLSSGSGTTGGLSSNTVWQSFTAVEDAALNEISFELRNPSSSSSSVISMELYENEGTAGNLIATSSDMITLFSRDNTYQYYDFGFSNVNLVSGAVYTIRLVSNNRANVQWIIVDRGNPYSGGRSSLDPTMDSKFRIETTNPAVVPVTLTVTDVNGTSNQVTVTVTLEDDTAPIIALTGDATVTIPVNGIYIEQGGTATDNCSINSDGVVIDSSALDNSQAGTYTVTYNANDTSGNAAAQVTRTVVVDVIPTLTAVSITSNNDNDSAFAKAGDIITISFTASEDLAATPVVRIAGQTAIVSQGEDAQTWTATYTVPTVAVLDQTSLPDGIIVFAIDFQDISGNSGTQVTAVTDASQMTVLRTPPSIVVTKPSLVRFDSEPYNLLVTDLNIEVENAASTSIPTTSISCGDPAILGPVVSFGIGASARGGANAQTFKAAASGFLKSWRGTYRYGGSSGTQATMNLYQNNNPDPTLATDVELIATIVLDVNAVENGNIFSNSPGFTLIDGSIFLEKDRMYMWQRVSGPESNYNASGFAYPSGRNFIYNPSQPYTIVENTARAQGQALSFGYEIYNVDQVTAKTVTVSVENPDSTVTSDVDVYFLPQLVPTLITQNQTASLDTNGRATIVSSLYDDGSSTGCGQTFELTGSQNDFDCDDAVTSTRSRSIVFNSNAQGINIGQVSTFHGSFTQEMWVKTTRNNQTLLAKWSSGNSGRSIINIDGSGKVFMSTNLPPYDNTVEPKSTTTISDGRWHHVAFTYDYQQATSEGVLKVYVDGNLENTSIPVPYRTEADDLDMFIGRQTQPRDYFQGEMDDVRVWNVARSAFQIRAGMKDGLNPNTGGLLRFYDANGVNDGDLIDLKGTSTIDVSGNASISLPSSHGIPVVVSLTDSANNLVRSRAFVKIEDTTAPILTLVGDATEYININDPYTDQGVTVADNCQINTSDIIVSGDTVDTSTAGSYTINYNITDLNGNEATQVTRTVLVQSAPQLTTVSLTSNNVSVTSNTTGVYAKDGNTITLTFVSDVDLAVSPSATIAGQMASVTQGADARHWTATFIVPTIEVMSQSILLDGTVVFGINFSTALGFPGIAVTTTSDNSSVIIDRTAPVISAVTIASDNSNTALALVGNLISVDIDSNEKIYINFNPDSAVTISGLPVNSQFPDADFEGWSMRLLIPSISSADLTTLPDGFATFRVPMYDEAGNVTVLTSVTDASEVFINRDAPDLTTVSISSNNVNSAFAKAGDLITLNFTASESLAATPVVTIAGQTATVTQGVDAQNWTATYIVPNIATVDQSNLPDGTTSITIDFQNSNSLPGNQVTATTNNTSVSIFRTLPTAITQNVTAVLNADGNATITPQQVNNGSTDADGNLITNLSLDQTTFSCSDLSSGIQSSFSVNLDGTNDFVSTGIDADVLAMPQTTWEGWINPNALTAGFQMIFSVDDGGWDRFLSLNGNNLVLSNGNSAATVTTMQPSVWQHVAVTYDQVNNEAFVYINGLQYGAYATTYANSDNTNDTFTLGKNSGGVNYFNGRIDEVRVWNTVRTPAQIKANYNSTVAVNETGLVAYYNFEEGTGTTASDISTASVNNATLNNFAAATAWNEGVRSYTEVDLTVTDNLGNINIGSALVEVIDNIAPVITLTGDATITLPINGVYNDQGATATDNCSLDGTGLVIDNSDVDTSLAGSYTVTYNATDEAGNSTTASRTVNVEDLTPPTLSDITIASNNTISNDIAGIGNTVNLSFTPSEPITNVTATFGGNNMTVVIPATAGDAYTATYIVQDGDDAGATGFSIRAEDLAANAVTVTTASTGTSTIDVDAIAPTFDYLRLSSRGGGESPGFAIPRSFTILSFTASEVVTPTTTIAGQPSSFTNFDSDDGVYGIGITIPQISTLDQTAMPDGNVTFSITLTDAKGNTTTRTSTTDGSSIILDRTPPSVVMIQPSAFILNSSNRAPVSLSEVYDSSSDANGIASVELEEDNFGCFDVGTESVRMVTVEDNAGNITRGVVDITVIDNVPPVITTDWPATQTVSVGNFPPSPNTRYTDNCTVVTRGSNLDDLDVSVPNTFTYTASATDAGGNTTTITRIVEVIQQPYIYDNGAWTPNDPSLSSNPSRFNSDVIVRESVTVSDDFNAHDLTIENGSMLSLASGVIVTIDNDCDAVAINAPSATLVAKDQSSSNSWTLNNTILGTLELDNATLELTGTIRVMNRLYNNDSASTSTLDVTSANLILNSNATSTAVVDGAGIMINGEVTVENYFNDRRAFRFLSSPVTTTTTINDNYQEGGNTPAGYGTDITGAGGAANGFDVSGSNNPSMFGWDNLNQTFTVQGSTDQAQDVLVAGQYSRLFIRGDRNVDLTSNTSSSATTLRTTGQLLNGNYTLPSIAANDNEFIIVGNPYQNKISIANEMNQLFNLSSTNINAVKPNFYFVWDPMANTRGAYRTYSRQIDMMTGANPANSDYDEAGILQPGQAAFMYASGTTLGSFVLSRPSNIPARRGEEMANTAEGILDISLYETSQFAQGLGSLDGLFVRFETGANNDVDGNDAVKFANLDENLGRQHDDGTSLIVEIRDVPQPQEVLVLKTDQYRHQNYTLRFAPLGFVSVQGKLRDNFTNTLTDLDNAQETIYSFTIDPNDAASMNANRFEVLFENVTLSAGDLGQLDTIKLYPNPITNDTFFINMAGLSGEKEVTITNLLGQSIITYSTNATGVEEFNTTTFAPSVYLVQITNEGRTKTIKVIVE